MDEMNVALRQEIFICNDSNTLGTEPYADYLAHALCTGGQCVMIYNDEEYLIKEGDLMIVRKGKLIERLLPDERFKLTIVYASPAFITQCTPQSNYGMKGSMALFLNPVMRLTPTQYAQCLRNFDWLHLRIEKPDHRFYREMIINTMQMLILDFFDFHAQLYDEGDISTQIASIMNRFLTMLENGDYVKNREVSYYADCLCVSPKYLSEVCNKVSGHSAIFWINRYTILDISRKLRNKELSFVDIANLFGFSSQAYFTRYVQQHLGISPTEYRQ